MRRGTAREHEPENRLFVDSGAWLALLHARDAHHASADAMFREARRGRARLLTTNLVIAEVQRLLLFRVGPAAAMVFLRSVDESELVEMEFVSRRHHEGALAWLARLADHAITYTDAVSFAVMTDARLTRVMSFDHDFVLAGFVLAQPRRR